MNEIDEIIEKVVKTKIYLPKNWESAWNPTKEDIIKYIEEGKYRSAAFCLKYFPEMRMGSEYKKLMELGKYYTVEKIPKSIQEMINKFVEEEKERIAIMKERAEIRRRMKAEKEAKRQKEAAR